MLPILTTVNRNAARITPQLRSAAPLGILRTNTARTVRPIAPYTTRAAHGPKSSARSNFAYATAFTGIASVSLLYSLKNPTNLESPPVSAFVNSNATTTIAELNDENNRIAVRSKTAPELMLSLAVYRMCTMTWLVDLAPRIIEFTEKIHISGPVYWVIKRTFFRQFCGGESAEDCVGTMNKLEASGIGSILDLSIEADLEDSVNPTAARAKWNQQADRVLELTKTCLETARSQPNSFAAIKITAFAPPSLLQDMTTVLQSIRDAFYQADSDADGRIRFSEFRDIVRSLPGSSSTPDADTIAATLFAQSDADKDGMIDFLEFSEILSIENPAVKTLFVSGKGLTPDHIEDYDRMMRRLHDLCDYARENNVRLMVDAEQSYFQKTIDHVALQLEREYNRKDNKNGPIIFNTYQMYLKEALSKLHMDVERARRENFVFGAKLVRGAYMVSERKRASELNVTDPIQPTLAATHASYDAGVEFLLNQLEETQHTTGPLELSNSPVVFMVASHNKDSVVKTCADMERHGIRARAGIVLFGQLLGMCDQLSYTLGHNGYPVYKYVPYGEVHEVIPYLIRRAQENSGVLGAVTTEHRLLWDELKGRLWGGKLKPQIEDLAGAARG